MKSQAQLTGVVPYSVQKVIMVLLSTNALVNLDSALRSVAVVNLRKEWFLSLSNQGHGPPGNSFQSTTIRTGKAPVPGAWNLVPYVCVTGVVFKSLACALMR